MTVKTMNKIDCFSLDILLGLRMKNFNPFATLKLCHSLNTPLSSRCELSKFIDKFGNPEQTKFCLSDVHQEELRAPSLELNDYST